MHVSRSPIARWTSTAATVESTPPDSPQHDAAVADLLADPRDALVDERGHRPVAAAAADAEREVAQDLDRPARCARPPDGTASRRAARSRAAIAATGALADVATTSNPGGAAATKSPWLAHTFSDGWTASNSGAPSTTLTTACPNSRCGARSTWPPSACGHELHAVADAERRCAQLADRRDRLCGAPGSDTLLGPPDRMMPGRLTPRDLRARTSRAAGSPSTPTARATGARSVACTASRNRERRSSDVSQAEGANATIGNDASRESRYYKRVPNVTTTTSWGVVIGLSLLLGQVTTPPTVPPVQTPAIPTATAPLPPPVPAFVQLWRQKIDAQGTLAMLVTDASLVITDSEAGVTARSIGDGTTSGPRHCRRASPRVALGSLIVVASAGGSSRSTGRRAPPAGPSSEPATSPA